MRLCGPVGLKDPGDMGGDATLGKQVHQGDQIVTEPVGMRLAEARDVVEMDVWVAPSCQQDAQETETQLHFARQKG
jgi:hypothetical protein